MDLHKVMEMDLQADSNGGADRVYDRLTLRREEDVVVLEVDGVESRLPKAYVNAYFTYDGKVAVSVYLHLLAYEANLLADTGQPES